jgi:peptide/nickel transport system substrate-binding protein
VQVLASKYLRHLRWLTVLFAISLVAAACGGSSKTGNGGNAGNAQKQGGSVVFAAEQWPECLSPITSCANASWLPWTAWEHVMPRLMQTDPKGNFVASDLLVEAPTEQNGGIKTNPFTLTYKLRPEAVWDDGSQITSEDVKFTWDAIMKTTGTIGTTGYEQIKSIDTSDPKTAVITFKDVYSDWQDLFGGNNANGVVLKKAAFSGKVNLKDEMQTSYGFSGGPWILKSYSPQQTVLVRNAKYWVKDHIPLLDQVTFVPRTDQSTEMNSLLTGEALAAFPQPSRGITQQLKAPGIKYTSGTGSTYEGLWMNLDRFPFNDKTAREAFAFAIDRQGVIDAIYKPDFPEAAVLNCAGWSPAVSDWCGTDFSDISYSPDKVKTLLEGSGWTKGGDGIYAKGGKRYSVEFNTTAGNKLREDTQALLKEKAKAAGIELVIKDLPATQLFEDRLPKREFTLAEYAQVASPDPSVTAILAADQIPSAANGNSGQNFLGWKNAEATALMKQSDKTIDHAQRLAMIKQINKLERQDIPWLPLIAKPLILTWHDDRLTGPIGDYAASSYSGFFNMYDWSLK